MIKFNKFKADPQIFDQWISTGMNVLLIGEKGVGKSHMILDAFKRNNLKYAYFSGATLDPWIHLLGIPKAKLQPDGTEKMEFILPENLDENVEAIFCDEWNRCHKLVRNALLELQQFKSINGRKFPNLKLVWGAINPPATDSEDQNYDVDELDPAQLDRFHIIAELPNEPNMAYFRKVFGDWHATILIQWWNDQPKDALRILSPRRLQYVGEAFLKGLDIKYLLPESANVKELIKRLSINEMEDRVNKLLDSPTEDQMSEFLSIDENFLKFKGKIKPEKYWKYWKYANKEFIVNEIKSNIRFSEFAISKVVFDQDPLYKDIFIDLDKKDSNDATVKVLKTLLKQNYAFPTVSNADSAYMNSYIMKCWNTPQSTHDEFSKNYILWPSVKKYSLLTYYRNMVTYDRRKAIGYLMDSLDIPLKTNPYEVVIFVMQCLASMQKSTIAGIPNFINMLATIVVFVKQNFDEKEVTEFTTDLSDHSRKISDNRFKEFIKYLKGEVLMNGILPIDFTNTCAKIRGDAVTSPV
jgi:hypothetical protein